MFKSSSSNVSIDPGVTDCSTFDVSLGVSLLTYNKGRHINLVLLNTGNHINSILRESTVFPLRIKTNEYCSFSSENVFTIAKETCITFHAVSFNFEKCIKNILI